MVRRKSEDGGKGENLTGLGKLDEVQLLALFRASDVSRDKRIHEGLGVGAPPLGEAVTNLPVARLLALTDAAHGREALVQAGLEAFDLIVVRAQVISWQL